MLFKILYWKPRLYKSADIPSPSIAIEGKHDLSYILINDTESDYDNKIYKCTPFINNRNETVLLLDVLWDGYPYSNGNCSESAPLPISDAPPTPLEYLPPKNARPFPPYTTYEA